MKKLVTIFGVLPIVLTAHLTHATPESDSQLIQIYDCARRLVQEDRGGKSGIQLAGTVLGSIKDSQNSPVDLKRVHSFCVASMNTFSQIHLDKTEKETAINELKSSINLSDNVIEVLKNISSLRIHENCKKDQYDIKFGILLAFGLGGAKTQCSLNDGTDINILDLQVEAGLGVAVIGDHREDNIDESSAGLELSKNDFNVSRSFKIVRSFSFFVATVFDDGSDPNNIMRINGVGFGGMDSAAVPFRLHVSRKLNPAATLEILRALR